MLGVISLFPVPGNGHRGPRPMHFSVQRERYISLFLCARFMTFVVGTKPMKPTARTSDEGPSFPSGQLLEDIVLAVVEDLIETKDAGCVANSPSQE